MGHLGDHLGFVLILMIALSATIPKTSAAFQDYDSVSSSVPIDSSFASTTMFSTSSSDDDDDDDPCKSNPCANKGTCVRVGNGNGRNFRCQCLPGFKGKLCQKSTGDDFFPFGIEEGDAAMEAADDANTVRQWVSHGIQVYCHRYRNFFVSINGFITLLTRFTRPSPPSGAKLEKDLTKNEDIPVLLAPLWADAVGGIGSIDDEDAVVYYQSYTKWSDLDPVSDNVTFVMNKATNNIVDLTGDTSFYASNVVVVTWYKMRRFSGPPDETGTFQLVLMTDHAVYDTYIQFIYGGISWDTGTDNAIFAYSRRTPLATEERLNKGIQSGTPDGLRMAGNPGNVGIPGSLIYRLSVDECVDNHGAEYLCRVWAVSQQNEHAEYSSDLAILQRSMPCPCTILQAMNDPRYTSVDPGLCFVSRQTFPTAQRCCYDQSRPFLRLIIIRFWIWLFRDLPLMTQFTYSSGSFSRYNQLTLPNQYEIYDRQPKESCCLQSDLCDVYYKHRPLDRCRRYIPPDMSWLFGDPHIRTTDGLTYTYNGLGEFWLQKPTKIPAEDCFRLQGRTGLAWGADGQPLRATVFVAFAAKDKTTGRVHVGLTEDRLGMIIRADDLKDDITSWYYNTTEDSLSELRIDNVNFRRMVDFVHISFPSGVALRLGVSSQQMDVMFAVDGEYVNQKNRGLFGVHNGDPSDDLTTPDGVIISSNSSEDLDLIHRMFGEKWRTQKMETLFWYENGTDWNTYQDPDFEPITHLNWTTLEEEQEAEALCHGNQACFYDLYVTKDKDFATNTKNIFDKNEDTETEIKNTIPVIDGPTEIEVTVGKEFRAIFTISDQDADDTVTQSYITPDGSTYNENTGQFAWTPEDMSEETLSFSAMDSRNASAVPLDVIIKLCNCSGYGECDFEHSLPGYNVSDPFQIVYCDCQPEWDGDHCGEDFDACHDSPCLPLQECTDLSPQEHRARTTGIGYNCSECPAGYTEVLGYKCQDDDECAYGTDDCDLSTTECINTIGNFTCSCLPDLTLTTLNRTHCQDVNECELLLHDCQQICGNQFGGFTCTCFDGYTRFNDTACEITDTDLQDKCANISACQGICIANGTGVICQCQAGYVLDGDGMTCNDVDECQSKNNTCGTEGFPSCNNIDGSYECQCDGGRLHGDLRSCQDCETGRWGSECSRLCNCATNATCDPLTGCSSCQPGWDGEECTEDVDECQQPGLCGADSTCLNTNGSYACACDEGFYRVGSTCEGINECELEDENKCENNAECVDVHLDVTCNCMPGFTGQLCETDIDECAIAGDEIQCQHGSTCMDKVNSFECICGEHYYGNLCQSAQCDPGDYISGLGCEQCPRGYYNPHDNMDECQRCPGGGRTAERGSTSEDDCIDRRRFHLIYFVLELDLIFQSEYLNVTSEQYVHLNTWVLFVVRSILQLDSYDVSLLGVGEGSTVVAIEAFYPQDEVGAAHLVEERLNGVLQADDATKLEHPNGTVECEDGTECPALPIIPGTVIAAVEIDSADESVCDPGYFLNVTTIACMLCPENTYQIENVSATLCSKCPEQTSTIDDVRSGEHVADICKNETTGDDAKDGGFPVLATALSSIMGTIVIVLIVFIICACCRKHMRRYTETSDVTVSDTAFSTASHVMPRPSWLHWYPGTAKPAGFVSRPAPSPGPVVGQWPRQQTEIPAIDWSILKRFAARTGHQRATGPISGASAFHRGPAPYLSPVWMRNGFGDGDSTLPDREFTWVEK